jgi:hypothetical protein
MQSLVVVVPHVAPQGLAKLHDRCEDPAMGQLGFQRMKERFHVGVLVGRPSSGHALPDAARIQTLAEWGSKKLASTIAVKDEASLWATIQQRPVYNSARELRVPRRGQTPGQNAARILIQNRRQIPPSSCDREIRQVTDPDPVGTTGLPTLHTIGILAVPTMGPCCTAIHTYDPCAPAANTHQSFDTPPAQAMALCDQCSMDAGTPVGSAALLEDDTHLFEYNPVLPHARTRRPPAPRIEPCPRDREEPTQTRHAERFVFLIDEREDVGFRAEVNRMSFFKSACSSLRSACARKRA